MFDYLKNNCILSVESGHSVLAFGESYPYPGYRGPAKCPPIPDMIKDISERLETPINQCLVNCCNDENSYLPEHADDEPCIVPNSTIYTLSLGAQRKIIFRNINSTSTIEYTALPCSLYSMTRSSQNIWRHRIDHEPYNIGTRFSLTFRLVSDK